MLKRTLLVISVLCAPVMSFAQQLCETGWPIVDVGTPAPSQTILTGNIHWTAGTVWHIQGFIYLDNGAVLTIDPGTIVKGDPGQGLNATVLVVSRGAKIIAQGTPTQPIVFTSTIDNVCDTGDIPDVATSRGQWGGMIICGKAFTCAAGGDAIMEGVLDVGPIAHYGGGLTPDCHDNSGILQYVSLRYPGSILEANVEVNGLSLGAVGDGTTIDHVEVFMANDDDIETWGGSVNILHSVIVYGDDDGWDTDECYTGMKQFGLMIKHPHWGDRETENDGRQQATWTDTTTYAPTAVPSGWGCAYPSYTLNANITLIGQGNAFDGALGDRSLFRDTYRGYWYNNVFMEQPKTALEIENKGVDANLDVFGNTTANLPSGAASIAAGHPLLDFVGNFWWQSYNKPGGTGSQYSHFIATGGAAKPLSTARVQGDIFPGADTTITGKNHIMDPQITSYETVNPPVRHGIMNPVPKPGSPLIGSAAVVPAHAQPNAAYVPTTYVGAFDPSIALRDSWVWGWTFVSQANILGPKSCCQGTTGDVNADIVVDISDIFAVVDFLGASIPLSSCADENDVNKDGGVDISDLFTLIDYLSAGIPLPACPI